MADVFGDRRNSKRYEVMWRITDGQGKVLGYLQNIGLEGAKINFFEKSDNGSVINFEIEPFDTQHLQKVKVDAEIVWRENAQQIYNETTGVRFIARNKETQDKINKLIAYITGDPFK